MPLDIELGEATPTAALALRQCQPLPGGQQFGAMLVIRSGGFAAALPFFVERAALGAWCTGIAALERGTAEEQTLTERDGQSFIAIAREHAAGVTIRGELHDMEERQRMSFRFTIGSRALAQLRRGLEEVLHE